MKTLLQKIYRNWERRGLTFLTGKVLSSLGRRLQSSSSSKKYKEYCKRHYQTQPAYLNVGGGNFVKPDWRVLDFYSEWYSYDQSLIDYNINLEENDLWPIEDNSLDLVFTSHTLEHLSNNAIERVIKESKRVLRPGEYKDNRAGY